MTMIEIDISPQIKSPPFWMICRWQEGRKNLVEAEREEAAKAGVTDFDDFGCGLCYNQQMDAATVAAAMARRFGFPFGIIGD